MHAVDFKRKVAPADRCMQQQAWHPGSKPCLERCGHQGQVCAVAYIYLEARTSIECWWQLRLALSRLADEGIEVGERLAQLFQQQPLMARRMPHHAGGA